MKTLSELIEAVQDVEAKAEAHFESYTWEASPNEKRACLFGFKAGARSQARLGLALKEAIDELQDYEHKADSEFARGALERIRRILEAKESDE